MTNLKAGKREWIALAVLTLPCMLYTIDLAVLYLAVPRLSAELKPSSSALLWIVDIRGFMIAGLLITMGTLGDRIGRRRLLFEVIPEFRNPGASRLDIVSVLPSIGAALAVIYGLKRIAEIGFAWLPAAFILVGFAIGFVFVRRQRGLAVRLDSNMNPHRLFAPEFDGVGQQVLKQLRQLRDVCHHDWQAVTGNFRIAFGNHHA
jgi:MFS family permease